jgi:hypothetical protein
MLALGVMLTPSHWLLSQQLNRWDLLLHFHQLALLHWSLMHVDAQRVLAFAYTAWSAEIILIAPLIALCGYFQRGLRYVLVAMIIGTISCVTYLIWPSLPPAADFPHYHHFEASSYELIRRYYAIRHYQPYSIGNCGLVAFPSYHVAMALLMIWATRCLKWAWPFFILFNGLVIASTLFLGYHYLVDTLASGVITGTVLAII